MVFLSSGSHLLRDAQQVEQDALGMHLIYFLSIANFCDPKVVYEQQKRQGIQK